MDGVNAAAMNDKMAKGRHSDKLFSEIPEGDYKRGYSDGSNAVASGETARMARETFDR